MGSVRLLVAIGVVALLLAGAVAPHHHDPSAGSHECVACTVGGALEARDATPRMAAPAPIAIVSSIAPALEPVTGAPLGAIPGQSPPNA